MYGALGSLGCTALVAIAGLLWRLVVKVGAMEQLLRGYRGKGGLLDQLDQDRAKVEAVEAELADTRATVRAIETALQHGGAAA